VGAPGDGTQGARRGAAVAALAVAAAVAFVAMRVPYLDVPLERDEGEYAYIAQRLFHGELPYRDAFDQKPPGVFAVYAVALAGLGSSAWHLHLAAALWTAVTTAGLALWVGRIAGGVAGGFTALVFGLASTDPRLFATAANTELFMLLPLVASAAALWRARETDGAHHWAAAGLGVGVGVLFKQVAAVQLLWVLAVALAAGGGAGARVRRVAAAGTAAVGPLLGVWGLFAALGAGGAFADAVLWHNLRYAGVVGPGEGLGNLLQALVRQAPGFAVTWGLALWAVVSWALRGRALGGTRAAPRSAVPFLAAWALVSFAGVASGLYFRPHYFLQTLPPLAALAGLALAGLVRPALDGGAARAAAALAGGVLLAAAPFVVANAGYWSAGSRVALARALYAFNPFPEAETIARHIRHTSGPDETVFIVGSEPEILFHAERRSATRYIILYPLTGDFPDASRRQREAMAEVRRARPRYVVWVHMDASLHAWSHTDPWLFDQARQMLADGYRAELVAVPAEPDGPFRFVRGEAARTRLRELAADESRPAWVALFRRAS